MALQIRGIISPILTPMNVDESVNETELRNQVNRMISGGVHGIFCLGTNGEGYILSDLEKERILAIVIDEAAKRVPVYAGTGSIGTRDTIRLSKAAERLGADALSIITPSFAAASQNELFEHYKAVAEAVHTPIVLYNIPARTGNSLAPATVARLANVDNIVGVKDSSGNFDNMKQYIEVTKNCKFAVLSGNDSLIIWCLLAGGEGGIAGCANVYPKTMSSIYDLYISGDLERAMEVQDSIRSFRNCFKYGNPNTIVKTAVELLGHPVGKCRKPFYSLPEEGVTALKAVLKENKEKGME
jgi:4-hydroxy-tetrahydrodipicolinate synthase